MRDRMYEPDKVYEFIVRYKTEHDGVGPGMEEIKLEFDMKSYNSVGQILDTLVEQGRITLGPGARMIYVTGATWNAPEESTKG